MQVNKRHLLIALGALLVVIAAGFGLSLTNMQDPPGAKTKTEIVEARDEALQEACASKGTYDRLKQVVFEEAVRIRNSDPANLDTLAAHAVVRMENPVVKSRDEELNVTVCSGRFVLELPPGAERGFGGERRLTANIEYAAQAAVDGSGLVYQMNGAEPIIYRLAAFDLQGQQWRVPAAADAPVQTADAGTAIADVSQPPVQAPQQTIPAPQTRPAPQAQPQTRPAPQPEPARTVVAATNVRPSFNCRYARTSGERMVCGSGQLAAKDRAMSSLYYSAMADANGDTKRALRSTRNRFLAYRDRCGSEACIAEAYDGRMREIRDIVDNLD